MNLIHELNQAISSPPTLIQVAINGIWEETWDISFEKGSPSLTNISDYLSKGSQDLAFEVFFKTNDIYDIILGIRCKEGLATKNPEEFLINSFQSIWSNNSSFSSIISNLSKKLTGDSHTLFNTDPTGVELGVINYWKSLGSLEVWNNKQEKVINKDSFQQKLKTNSHLLENNKNYVGMEFNYRLIPHYWIGIQVSDKQGENYILNKERIEKLLYDLLQVKLTE